VERLPGTTIIATQFSQEKTKVRLRDTYTALNNLSSPPIAAYAGGAKLKSRFLIIQPVLFSSPDLTREGVTLQRADRPTREAAAGPEWVCGTATKQDTPFCLSAGACASVG